MPNSLVIKKKIKSFNNIIQVSGDKSLSIRFALLASQAIGKSTAYNLLKWEEINNNKILIPKVGPSLYYTLDRLDIHSYYLLNEDFNQLFYTKNYFKIIKNNLFN